MRYLVTGCAGFIGFYVSLRLLQQGAQVIGIDNLNDYYDVNLKQQRLAILQQHENFSFNKIDLTDKTTVADLFATQQFNIVIHLAAQAGVRYSLTNPYAYIDSNLLGFMTILEGCRQHKIEHLIFASSSSVYGKNTCYPYSEKHPVDHPISLYAATKKANEMMAHSYAHLYGLPCTGLRFFTVYGPWGRPDMAPLKFTKKIMADESIDVFNHGNMARDFTYIDDIVDGIMLVAQHPAHTNNHWSSDNPDAASSSAPYRIYNIGRGKSIALLDFIAALEKALGKKAKLTMLPMQPGDIPETFADIHALAHDFGYHPKVDLKTGVTNLAEWYREYSVNHAVDV